MKVISIIISLIKTIGVKEMDETSPCNSEFLLELEPSSSFCKMTIGNQSASN